MGSPRLNGNTAKLIDIMLEGAAEIGMSTERIDLVKLNINACVGCDNCKKGNGCIHDDDYTSVIKKIGDSNIVLFGTPIYWLGPTAQFKTFFDRLHGVHSSGFLKDKEIILVMPFESKDEKMPALTTAMIKRSLGWIGIKGFKTFSVPGVYAPKDVEDLEEVMTDARNLIKEYTINFPS